MKSNVVKSVINEWDPINLFPLAPENEYEVEIASIGKFMEESSNMTVAKLSKRIGETFVEAFGIDVYTQTSEGEIAKQILKNFYND
ncbi:DUF1871 domain-containing protein [Listeria ilorinensis]|uniref:DUF1871 domain-containing protein n=1 Tax=Listeria ilorinensis TaxID=2867439 RepID=UPI001EF41A5D|nr:DUF1871 domain-containing protein [Listeria ilorinensis]